MSMGLHLKKNPITFSDKAIWPSFVLIRCTTLFLDIILNNFFCFQVKYVLLSLYVTRGKVNQDLSFFGINYILDFSIKEKRPLFAS